MHGPMHCFLYENTNKDVHRCTEDSHSYAAVYNMLEVLIFKDMNFISAYAIFNLDLIQFTKHLIKVDVTHHRNLRATLY